MTDNIHEFPNRRPARSGNGSQPASTNEAIALLTACLALVRPVGMGEDEASDWLGAAVTTIGPVPIGLLDRACLTARRTCTHHSQIVPAIIAEVESERERSARLDEFTRPVSLPPPSYQMSQEELDELVAERGRGLSVALDRGLAISNGDGTFRLPDQAA